MYVVGYRFIWMLRGGVTTGLYECPVSHFLKNLHICLNGGYTLLHSQPTVNNNSPFPITSLASAVI